MAASDPAPLLGTYASPNRPFGAPATGAHPCAASPASPRLAVARPRDLRLVGELVPRSELRLAEAELRLAQERSSGLERELAASERSERSLSRYADRMEQRLTEREAVYQDEIARLNRALEERERALRTLSYRLGRAEALAGTPAPEFAGFDVEADGDGGDVPVHELRPAPRRAAHEAPEAEARSRRG
jgi:multidrug efflux pump subunit AcrA (membrane-fusion protein)